jgi:hypothetical protein
VINARYDSLATKYKFGVPKSHHQNKSVRKEMLEYGEFNRNAYSISSGVMKKMVDDRYWYLVKQDKTKKAKAIGQVDHQAAAKEKKNRANARTQLVK